MALVSVWNVQGSSFDKRCKICSLIWIEHWKLGKKRKQPDFCSNQSCGRSFKKTANGGHVHKKDCEDLFIVPLCDSCNNVENVGKMKVSSELLITRDATVECLTKKQNSEKQDFDRLKKALDSKTEGATDPVISRSDEEIALIQVNQVPCMACPNSRVHWEVNMNRPPEGNMVFAKGNMNRNYVFPGKRKKKGSKHRVPRCLLIETTTTKRCWKTARDNLKTCCENLEFLEGQLKKLAEAHC